MRRQWMAVMVLALGLLAGGPAGAEAPSTESARATAGDAAKTTTRKKTTSKRSTSKKASSKKASTKKASSKKARKKGPTEIPVDVAFGPAFHWMTGPIQDDQAPHYGLKLSVKAIIDQETIKANKGKIPKKYRAMASKVNEARISPSIFIPDTLYISPKTERVGLYGINFRPLALNIPLIQKPRLTIGAGLDLSYIYIDGEDAGLGTTHFLRPGIDLAAELEIPLSKTFLVSVGWQSMFFPPQELNGDILAWGELDDSIWHIGQAFVLLHFRFPYAVQL